MTNDGRVWTRRGVFVAGVAGLLALGGCTGGAGGSGANAGSTNSPDVPKTADGDAKPAGGVRAALVLDTGGVDDHSFNAAAWAGMLRAQKELGLSDKDIKKTESKDPSDYKTNLSQLASANYDIVFAVGFKMKDALAEVAPQFPNVKFAIIDAPAPDLPNCVGLQFKEEQGSFLAGFLAASVSKSKKIGFVGGENIPLIQKFEAGYRAGAQTADPATQVTATYTGSWEDQAKGKTQAQQQFGGGADVIYQAAGKAGLGVIQAATEKGEGYYAIGVDMDQDGESPGRVLTSMVKHLDTAVFNTVKLVKEGKFEKGTRTFDLKEGGVGLSEMKYTKQLVTGDVQTKLEKVGKMIANGQLVVPTTLDELKTFQPPKL